MQALAPGEIEKRAVSMGPSWWPLPPLWFSVSTFPSAMRRRESPSKV